MEKKHFMFITALGTRLTLHIYILKHGKTYTDRHTKTNTTNAQHTYIGTECRTR